MTKWTLTYIENLKPREKRYTEQQDNLIIRVQPTGNKSWFVYMGRGRPKYLGKYPELSLSEARKEVSVLILVTGISIFILEWMGRFDSGLGAKIGVSELGVEALIFAVALYSIGRSLRVVEFDFGKFRHLPITRRAHNERTRSARWC